MGQTLEEFFGYRGDLAAGLCAYFQIGPGFTKAYLNYFEKAQGVELRAGADLARLSEPQRMWLHYALSTNGRGRDLVDEVERYQPLQGRRYLDIGCGFGGAVVAAARRGARAVGIEVDRQRLELAGANVRDFGLTHSTELRCQDGLDPEIAVRLGRFDAITCNDVAEHVDKVEQLFQNLGALLAPGGVAYVEVPNSESVDFVRSDGHFGLFGITLLKRRDAMRYHAERFPGTAYDVGEYRSFEEYEALFERFGMQPRRIPSLYHPMHEMASAPARLRALEEALAAFSAQTDLSGEIRELVQKEVSEYLARVRKEFELAASRPARELFRRRYLCDFWTFVGVKG